MAGRQLSFLKSFCNSCLGLAGTLAVSTSMTATLLPAAAQEPDTVLDKLEEISENRSGNLFRNRSVLDQVRVITGIGGFSENRLVLDAETISEAYDELLILQTQNTPTLRVRDLPNPYTSSVQLLPTSQFDNRFDSRAEGSELNFELSPR